ncbi:MAG: hypothetical protein OXH36_05165 [Bdellovibrionales bacterium]|nr:hypothetical protein [Bdellovibrionales bacterium]
MNLFSPVHLLDSRFHGNDSAGAGRTGFAGRTSEIKNDIRNKYF